MNVALCLRLGLSSVTVVALMLVTGIAAEPADAASSAWFSSPSRNIGCMMTLTDVRCDTVTHRYTPPPKPAACHFAWGPSIGLGTRGRGHFLCVSDTVAGAPKILRYGTSRIVGRFTCTSRTTGMRCVNTRNGHGFRISRSSYRLF